MIDFFSLLFYALISNLCQLCIYLHNNKLILWWSIFPLPTKKVCTKIDINLDWILFINNVFYFCIRLCSFHLNLLSWQILICVIRIFLNEFYLMYAYIMQMRGNLHRYRLSPSGKRNLMLQGTYMRSYRPVLKFAAYGLLYTLLIWNMGRWSVISVSNMPDRLLYTFVKILSIVVADLVFTRVGLSISG